jgi:type 2 lantibiotic biosynthesis protein LanM
LPKAECDQSYPLRTRAWRFQDSDRGKTSSERCEHDIQLLLDVITARLPRLTTADGARFARTLAWDGWTPEDLADAVADRTEKHPEPADVPWLTFIESALERIARSESDSYCAVLRSTEPIPFEELLGPLAGLVSDEVVKRAQERNIAVVPSAVDDHARCLLRDVAEICGRSLFREFALYRARSVSRLQLIATSGNDVYAGFVRTMRREGLARCFDKYAAAARLVGTAMCNWRDATEEILDRADHDCRSIARDIFGGGKTPRLITGLTVTSAEPHHGARRAVIVTFDDRLRVVYKPREVAIDSAFSDLLVWVEERGWPYPFCHPKFVLGNGYGWMEYLTPSTCTSRAEVERYFYRAGGLLAVLRLLGVFDCHAENVIACGEQPVLIDAETAMAARIVGVAPAVDGNGFTVLDPYFLPALETGEGKAWDVSGICGESGVVTGLSVNVFRDVNTNRMAATSETLRTSISANRVTLHDVPVDAAEFEEAIVRGYKRMYRLLARCRGDLGRRGGPLDPFRDLKVRHVFRPTSGYLRILDRGHDPNHLQTGIDREALMSQIAHPFADASRTSPLRIWPIIEAERAALLDDDVPRLTASTTGRWLELEPGRVVDNVFEQSGFDDMLDRLRSLAPDALTRDMMLIRGALVARYHTSPALEAIPAPISRAPRPPSHGGDDFLAIAGRIADSLQDSGVVPREPKGAWLSLEFDQATGARAIRPMGLPLYDGVAGTGVFLAALAAATNEERYRKVALIAADYLRTAIMSDTSALPGLYGIGGCDGSGSLLYALGFMANALDDSSLLQVCERVMDSIEIQLTGDDQPFDVISGAAGTILTLVAHYEFTGLRRALALADHCADYLWKARTPVTPGWVWPALDGTPQTGFSHGGAGIAAAFLRLARHSRKLKWREAGRQAIEFERSKFNNDTQQWADLRTTGSDRHHAPMNSWCHGATGIGLGRLSTREILRDPAVDHEIDVALRQSVHEKGPVEDSLCCGRSGRVDFLLAATRLPDSRSNFAREQARKLLTAICRGSAPGRLFRLNDAVDLQCYNAGLFRGLSGIGYVLARAAAPRRIPCLSAFEVMP